jgi:hypothetical protein
VLVSVQKGDSFAQPSQGAVLVSVPLVPLVLIVLMGVVMRVIMIVMRVCMIVVVVIMWMRMLVLAHNFLEISPHES